MYNKQGRWKMGKERKEDIELVLKKVFGPLGLGTICGEYKTLSFKFFEMNDCEIGYEIISAFPEQPKPLSLSWWEEFTEVVAKVATPYFLLVTERPLDFVIEGSERLDERILKTSIPTHYAAPYSSTTIFVVDMSTLKTRREIESLIERAKSLLQTLVKDEKNSASWPQN
jgi:hypothetical protein